MNSTVSKSVKQLARYFFILATLLLANSASASDAATIVFIAGKVEVAGKIAVLNSQVQEGNDIKTGADGYVYLKTIDNGFLILRPNSAAKIVNYHVDNKNPANTLIKLELQSGVARSISGDAVKLARQNFRFNTPIAAIGVRGTDFTVYTTDDTSRVAVISGGIVVSGFNASCLQNGSGPCEGVSAQELFARQQGQLLQINKGQAKPQLVTGNGLSPDVVSPPRSDEPSIKASLNSNNTVTAIANTDSNLDLHKGTNLTTVTASTTDKPVNSGPIGEGIIWGRWQAVLGQPANVDAKAQDAAQAKFIAINDYFSVYLPKSSTGPIPTAGTAGFALKASEAYVFDAKQVNLTAAKVDNGVLTMDFDRATFNTSFDLTISKDEKLAMQTHGNIASNGGLSGVGQYASGSNMAVNGVVADKVNAAAYLFRSQLDDNRVVNGATYWGKK